MMARLSPLFLQLPAALALSAVAALAEDARITLDPGQHFQTFHDWEATVVLLDTPEEKAHREEFYDRLIDEVQITRLRVEIYAGQENDKRGLQRLEAGEIDEETWYTMAYATVNDDADPHHINPAGFDYYVLDWKMDNAVLPLLERAKARGVDLQLNMNYVAFTDRNPRANYDHLDPEEYAEFILANFLHMKEKYGLVPEYFEPLLEPDNCHAWTPQALGRATKAAMDRLRAAGFHPRLILPSLANANLTPTWLDGIAETPGALDGLSELSFHRYYDAMPNVLRNLAERADRLGATPSMLEYWFGDATYQLLHRDLTFGNVSAWQPRATLSYHKITPEGLQLEDDIRYNRLYFVAIRRGDVRIGAGSSDMDSLNPVAFEKPDGGMSVVLLAGKAASGVIEGLPPGDYTLETATAAGNTGPTPVHVGPDGLAAVAADGPGVISLRPADGPG